MPSTETAAPSSPLAGKSKTDLIQIAELTGLVPAGKGKSLTVARLTELITTGKADAAAAKTADKPARRTPGRKKAAPAAAAASDASGPAQPVEHAAAAKPVLQPTDPAPQETAAPAQPDQPAPAKPRGTRGRPRKAKAPDPSAEPAPAAAPQAVEPAAAVVNAPPPVPEASPKKIAPQETTVADAPQEKPATAQETPATAQEALKERDNGSSDRNPGNRQIPRTHHNPRRHDDRSARVIPQDRRHRGVSAKPIHPNNRPNEYAQGDMPASDAVRSPQAEQTDTAGSPAQSADEQRAKRQPDLQNQEILQGVLEIMPDGYGFLRKENYIQGTHDVYVPPQYIRRFGLREGDLVSGPSKPPRENDRYPAILYIKEVNGMPPERMVRRPTFDRLTPIYPLERFHLETARNELSTRIIDLVAPIGKGQRGMIVSPPKAGKTILLQKLANAIATNNPECKLIVLLIDERPEEVTDMQRTIQGEVVYSTFDKTPENHVKVTELVLERAMRLVELKQDVVILLDSMTRLSRAYNLTITPTGRTLSGGLDPGALYGPKRFFGAARNIENGGSLTIIATSLIETGSRMDEMIYEEFKGTGNMEVFLDRKLSEKRIFPAIDLNKSGTRREELLLESRELDAVWTIRKAFGQLDTSAVTEMIINLLLKTKDNAQFISSVNISMNDKTLFDAMRGQNLTSQPGAGRSMAYTSTNGYSSNGYNAGNRKEPDDA